MRRIYFPYQSCLWRGYNYAYSIYSLWCYYLYPTKNFSIRNVRGFTKPDGGFWASRIDAKFGWKEWCEAEDFRECLEENSLKFTIKNTAKVVLIKTVEDLLKLPLKHGCTWGGDKDRVIFDFYEIDFERCVMEGVDAIELSIYGDNESDYYPIHYALYGWDCDSILIMNPNIVEVME